MLITGDNVGNILDVYDKLIIGTSNPIKADFIGCGNVWINNTYAQSVINLARYIVFEALTKTAPGQLSILAYDSDLSGVFSPFAMLSAGESKQLEIISDDNEFKEHLGYLRQQIQAVQNVVQGRNSSLIDFRRSIDRPIEGYKLVVLSLDMLLPLLPEGTPWYDPDILIDGTERFMASEVIRGRVLALLRDEVPHCVAVEIDEYKSPDEYPERKRLYIRASLIVETAGQKAILIGAGGAMLKRIGETARLELEESKRRG